MITRRVLLFFCSPFLLTLMYGQTPGQSDRARPSLFRPDPLTLQRTVDRSHSAGRSTGFFRVLAILVDFQPDSDTLTSGNGKFLLQSTDARMIDPPPHDSLYFTDKLRFLSNYFRSVSNGKVMIQGHVLGRVVTLSKQMSAYSPPKDGSDNRRLADLVLESWRKADSIFVGFPFSQYDAFVIFHAGIGRDVDLVSLLGFDPTPNDIPSITFNLKNLRQYLRDDNYAGIPVSGGSFFITNTMVLPEAETRVFRSGSRTDTLHLSMNGLLAASFGTFLGLPDLFNTKTGASAIGRFGLMDGASISAYNGLFPPHPSAWEKVWLGWSVPITVSSTQQIELPAVGLTATDDRIYKVPINDREYFLIENRIRDPHGNGQRLLIRDVNRSLREIHFAKDTTGFRFDDVRAIAGSVVDVEDFDWALPGFPGDQPEFHGGGLLIWHIDERIIQQGLVNNTINADPAARGVDLEEADGSQDIGRRYDLLEPGFGTESGWPLDFWFSGNPAQPYKNFFGETSNPNSKSNSGSRSLVTIRDISSRGPTMTATVEVGVEKIKPLVGFPIRINGDLPFSPLVFDIDGDGVDEFITTRTLWTGPDGRGGSPTGRGVVVAWKQNGAPAVGSSFVVAEIDAPSIFNIAMTRLSSQNEVYIAAGSEDGVYLWRVRNSSGSTTIERVFKISGGHISVAFVDTTLFAYGGSGNVQRISLRGEVTSLSGVIGNVAALVRFGNENKIVLGGENKMYVYDLASHTATPVPMAAGDIEYLVSGDVRGDGQTQVVGIVNHRMSDNNYKKTFLILDADGVTTHSLDGQNFLADVGESFLTPPALADLDGDGKKEIVLLSNKGRLFAFNGGGSLVDGFPVAFGLPPISPRSGPLVGDVTGDGKPDILRIDAVGDLWMYQPGSTRLPENVVRFGDATIGMPALFRTEKGEVGIVGTDYFGKLSAYSFSSPYVPSRIHWPMYRYNGAQTSATLQGTPDPKPLASEFLSRERTYNWPNPVYGSSTNIRFYTSEDAQINIKVYDLAGEKVSELRGQSRGGVDGEVVWDVSGVQSGVYFARIEAVGTGRTEAAVIKIAVVK